MSTIVDRVKAFAGFKTELGKVRAELDGLRTQKADHMATRDHLRVAPPPPPDDEAAVATLIQSLRRDWYAAHAPDLLTVVGGAMPTGDGGFGILGPALPPSLQGALDMPTLAVVFPQLLATGLLNAYRELHLGPPGPPLADRRRLVRVEDEAIARIDAELQALADAAREAGVRLEDAP